MNIIIGRAAILEYDLTLAGSAVAVPNTATVTAQLFSQDGLTALSGAIPVLANAVGANWPLGHIVINLQAADTQLLVEEWTRVVVTVNNAGAISSWNFSAAVDSAADNVSLLFEKDTAIAFIRANALNLASSTYGLLKNVSDDGLWLAIKAAEAQVGRKLKIPLAPTEIFTDEPTVAELAALNGKPYLVEPGYDMEPDFFSVSQWGALALRQTPVIEIKSMKLVYPSQGGAVFEVPKDWIRVDKKYGHLHTFPSAQLVSAPLSVFIMQAMTSGNTIPNMIRVRYVAGLQNVENNYPDLLTLVYRSAALSLIGDALLAQSASISADGLSQSISNDMGKLQGSVSELLEDLREQLVGPIYEVL